MKKIRIMLTILSQPVLFYLHKRSCQYSTLLARNVENALCIHIKKLKKKDFALF
jgi:hypothetical protein